MEANEPKPDSTLPTPLSFFGDPSAAERLERGEILFFPSAPFALPSGDDLQFLLAQQLTGASHKALSLDPSTGNLTGHAGRESERFVRILSTFAGGLVSWLGQEFPSYGAHARPDRVSFRPDEEANRRLRYTARNDLLHVDAFPNRPSWGDRILRVFANVNPVDPRVWVTSEPFAVLLERYGKAAGLPGRHAAGWFDHVGWGMLQALSNAGRPRSPYDAFMLRFHDFLKRCEDFQERGRKRLWCFPPGSAWMAFTDACSYGELRGRFALEHSFFVAADGLKLPPEAPAALLRDFGDGDSSLRAA